MNALLDLDRLTVRRGARAVVDGVSLRVAAGEVVGLLGPNGAGKTTLLRAALGLLPHEGRSSLARLSPRERARMVAFLPQGREIAWPVPVADLVALGRAPHGSPDRDDPAVARAIARMALEDFRTRPATELSGGEQARVLIARTLAQETPLILADEPVAGLDPEAQIRTMQVFADHARAGGAVVASIHDLGLAARHCTRLVLLKAGRLVADGTPREVLTEANLAQVFAIRGYHAETGDGPVFLPLGTVA
ncbi:MAG: ABC transporter ATP-binding protein [Rubellimicrobium sp.]|nr:ABC transporter ATP-binding protein [Rubellimicrobium sp.]